MRSLRWPLLLVLSLPLALASCGEDSDSGADGSEAQISVVATTPHVADLVRNVGGERVDVHGILPAGSDPHDYEPRPSDAASLTEAPVVFKSGGDLDGWLDDLLDSAGGDAELVSLIDRVNTIEGGHHHDEHAEEEHAGESNHPEEGGGHADEQDQHAEEEHSDEEVDPHWWQDPRNAVLAVAAVRDALIAADPDGGDSYRRNAARYTKQLERLDSEIAACMEQVPVGQRKLVTTHDALGYFAKRYDVEVIGALIPSLSTQAQPSVKDINNLVDQIRAEGVQAIFPETAINDRLEQAVSQEAGAKVGKALWADSLGAQGSSGDTYLKAMAFNTQAMVDGMTDRKVTCRPSAS